MPFEMANEGKKECKIKVSTYLYYNLSYIFVICYLLIIKYKLKNEKFQKFEDLKKKKNPEYPGFELGNSDPIANHMTTRPRSHYRI